MLCALLPHTRSFNGKVETGSAKIGFNKVLINYKIIYLDGEQSIFIYDESSWRTGQMRKKSLFMTVTDADASHHTHRTLLTNVLDDHATLGAKHYNHPLRSSANPVAMKRTGLDFSCRQIKSIRSFSLSSLAARAIYEDVDVDSTMDKPSFTS